MTKLTNLTPSQLAGRLEAAQKATSKAADGVFALALHSNERFAQICNRLGYDHSAVEAWRAALARTLDLENECGRRFGPNAVSHPAHWVTALRTRLAGRKVRS